MHKSAKINISINRTGEIAYPSDRIWWNSVESFSLFILRPIFERDKTIYKNLQTINSYSKVI